MGSFFAWLTDEWWRAILFVVAFGFILTQLIHRQLFPRYEEWSAKYKEAVALAAAPPPELGAFKAKVRARYDHLPEPITDVLVQCAGELMQDAYEHKEVEEVPAPPSYPYRFTIDPAEQIAKLDKRIEQLKKAPDDQVAIERAITNSLFAIVRDLPTKFSTDTNFLTSIWKLWKPSIGDMRRALSPFAGLQKNFLVLSSEAARLEESELDADEPAGKRWIEGTSLSPLMSAKIPYFAPMETRFEHHWIVAGSGHGKTQTMQAMIAKDLELVREGKASIIVIDSQSQLIDQISHLKFFADNPDRLCLIDPKDIEFPVALNLFDMGTERIDQYSALDREVLLNSVADLTDYILGALLSSEMSSKQDVIFGFVTRLMLQIKDANIHTYLELMTEGGLAKYQEDIARLDPIAQQFFATEFPTAQYRQTKDQVRRRIWGILQNTAFQRMFLNPKSKIDLFAEMNAGKVILINTAKDLLRDERSRIFGRFFISLIVQASQERAPLHPDKKLPTFVYLDESHEYLDGHIAELLAQARKSRIGLIFANQELGRIPPMLLNIISANTSIKFAGGTGVEDARTLAKMLRTTPEFIHDAPKGFFAAHIRGQTQQAISLEAPFFLLNAMERSTPEEFENLRNVMRERYAVPAKTVQLLTPENIPAAKNVPATVTLAKADPESDKAEEWPGAV